jgi:DNA-binding transcriptional MerR regulator
MRELAEATGVSAGTIKHYLREGLLPEPVKTSRNMAYYPPEFVERVKLIKQLQEERFLPLKVIKEVLAEGDGGDGARRLRALIELVDRVLERALRGQDARGHSDEEIKQHFALPDEVLERLERLELVTPQLKDGKRRYGPDDVQIIQAIERMRASGYSEALGFTIYDALIYKRHLERLVSEEVGVMMERLAGEMDTDEAAELIGRAAEPIRDLIAALREKLLIAELRARRAAQQR